MRIINVIEVKDNDVQTIESFYSFDDQLDEDIENANDLFTKLAIKNGAIEDYIEDFIKKGVYKINNYSVCIVFSYVE